MVDWSQRYMPSGMSEVVGQNKALKKVEEYVKNYKPGDKPVLLHGPPGSGKNAIVQAVASDLGLELVEINASDKRNSEAIRQTVGSASKQASLLGKGKVILVDEVDGLYGVQDRGAVPELKRVIKSSSFPIVLTANDPWSRKLSSLRSSVKMVKMSSLSTASIVSILKRICEAESMKYDLVVLERIAENSKGDARAAINDLQTMASGKDKITLVDAAPISERQRKTNIFDTLSTIFRQESVGPSVLDLSDKSLEETMLWIAESLPKEYRSSEEVAHAYEMLSRADVMLGRIHRQQHWRLKYYAAILASTGVACAKKRPRSGWVSYGSPTKIKKLWSTKSMRSKRQSILEKVAELCHCSTKVATGYLPLLKMVLDSGSSVEGLELDEKEVKLLTASS